MKKKLQSLIFIHLYFAVLVLSQTQNTIDKNRYKPLLLKPGTACDTLKNYAGSDYTLYFINEIDDLNTGYVSGTNSYMDMAKAEAYTANATGKQLTGAAILFAVAKSANGDNTVTVNVWSDNGGVPGNVLASKQVKISSIKENKFSFIVFDNPVYVSNNFYIGFNIPTDQHDTIAVATCKSGYGTDNTGWEQGADGRWHTYSSVYMDLQADNIIFPIFCSTLAGTGKNAPVQQITIYPNPAIDVINIGVNNNKADNIKISVYNLLGELIVSECRSACINETFHLNIINAKAGLYYVTTITANETITKCVILKK